MGLFLDALSWLCLLAGGFFGLVSGLGLLRLPDIYTRMHAAGITDTLAAGLILLGLAFQGGMSFVTVKLGLIFVFLIFTSPTSTHALAQAALFSGLKPRRAGADGYEAENGPL